MRLYLARHAQAHAALPDGSDDDRALTPHGLAQAAHLALALASGEHPWLPAPTRLATSPILRASQTADLLADALGIRPEPRAELSTHAPEHHADALLARILAVGEPALLVGHNPTISALASRLCRRGGLDLRTGELVALELEGQAPARLAGVLRLAPGAG